MNAKEEFLSHTRKETLKCAIINQDDNIYWDEEEDGTKPDNNILLPIGFTEEQYNKFLSKLDFNYNNGFGGQNLFGIIWNNDGTWLERGEYDGSEWWQFHAYPDIPEELYIDKTQLML